jgi:hypothetical protein
MTAHKPGRPEEPDTSGGDAADDAEFQARFLHARQLDGEQLEQAVRHGLEAQTRFADQPFEEVEHYLEESWQALGPPAPWDQVRDLVQGGYEWQRAAGVDRSSELGDDALGRFGRRTEGGSAAGGILD